MTSNIRKLCFACCEGALYDSKNIPQKVNEPGFLTLKAKLEENGEIDLLKTLVSLEENELDIYVHLSCRRKLIYYRKRKSNIDCEEKKLQSVKSQIPVKRPRYVKKERFNKRLDESREREKTGVCFTWKDCCLLCSSVVSKKLGAEPSTTTLDKCII